MGSRSAGGVLLVIWALCAAPGRAKRAHVGADASDLRREQGPFPDSVTDAMYKHPCPFQKWYSNIPEEFETMKSNLVNTYTQEWKAKGSPTGIRKNDHNYNTKLGQGNTLGFVAAKLTLGQGPEYTKHGLFAEVGSFPTVVRLSDFGDDASDKRLLRVALKVPLASAWGGEANLLFTESMDTFPIANHNQLVNFAGASEGLWANMRNATGMALNGAWVLGLENFNAIIRGKAFKEHALAKYFYSQLPYKLGDKAMKFSLVPKQRTCEAGEAESMCCLPATKAMSDGFVKDRNMATAAYLAKCQAVFELKLQVRNFGWGLFPHWNEDSILHEAATSWSEAPVTVGVLTIPQQRVDPETGVGEKLRTALASALEVQPEGVDKMFAFHPINNHEDNRPIGDINVFRAAFYGQHAAARFQTYEKGVFKTKGGEELTTVQQMPFDALKDAGIF